MPPKNKNDREKQEIASTDVGSLSEVLGSSSEKDSKELRLVLEELQSRYDLLMSNSEEFQSDLIIQRHQISQLQDELVSARDEISSLKKKQEVGKHDKIVHLGGVPYKIVHQDVTREFFEDIKKRIVPEEAVCLAVVKE